MSDPIEPFSVETYSERLAAAAVPVVRVGGEVDVATVGQFEAQLDAAVAAATAGVVVDLCRVTFVDSTSVNALLNARRSLSPERWLRVAYTHTRIGRLFELCGIADVFPQYASATSAVNDHLARRSRATAAPADAEESL